MKDYQINRTEIISSKISDIDLNFGVRLLNDSAVFDRPYSTEIILDRDILHPSQLKSLLEGLIMRGMRIFR